MVEAKAVRWDEDSLILDLQDGRTLSVPLVWFPTLLHASPEERADMRIMSGGDGLRWEGLDLDLSVQAMLDGRPERVPVKRRANAA